MFTSLFRFRKLGTPWEQNIQLFMGDTDHYMFDNLPKLKTIMALWPFCSHRTTWAGKFQKASYSFHPISAKLYADIGNHGTTQALFFLVIGQFLTILWHFERGSQWENRTMFNIMKKLIVGWNGWKFGTRGIKNCIYTCKVLFVSDSLSSVWGHSVHFLKFFSDLKIFERLLSPTNFIKF